MRFHYHLFTLSAAIAVLLGLLPLVVSYTFDTQEKIEVLAEFSTVAWLLVGVLLIRHRSMLKTVREAADSMGLSGVEGGVSDIVRAFAAESTRYHRAAYALHIDRHSRGVNLSRNLCRIAELAYRELSASAVELSLFEEETGLWPQGVLIGSPLSAHTQSLLHPEFDPETPQLARDDKQQVIITPVKFAGTTFGALRVEFEAGRSLTESDRHVLTLLAAQGGIMLVDARFTVEVLRMRKASEETTRAKTGFLANLSHEIRGPLGIILNGVELSLDGLVGKLTEQQKEMLQMIKESGDHLLDLVNDVLDFAKVEAGKIAVMPVEISVADLLDDICSVVRTQALAKNHKLNLEPVDSALGVVCDKRHARQMMINFLTNAIKYTPDGGTITVSALREADRKIRIIVADTGIGIAEDEKEKVFGAFERIENSYASSQGGTGLGMPLTRRLAEVNQGTVGFESTEGEGSTFWILLPGIELDETETTDNTPGITNTGTVGSGELVLLVDRPGDSRKMLERYLTEQGFRIALAESAAQVLRSAREQKPDLAVVENDLPDVSGEEVITALRSTPLTADMPIILLSTRAFVFDIERFLKLGADRCLSKPVGLAELALTSRKLIDEKRNLEADSSSGASE